jgi:hypothetical protein
MAGKKANAFFNGKLRINGTSVTSTDCHRFYRQALHCICFDALLMMLVVLIIAIQQPAHYSFDMVLHEDPSCTLAFAQAST